MTENQPADMSQYPKAVRMMQTAFQRSAVRRVIGIHRIEHLIRLPGHRGGAG